MRVSVLIPTFRRPESFRRAALSVFAQRGVPGLELIAVDNSPEGSALPLFEKLATCAQVPFRWAHEPRPGVAHARNAALKLAQGDYVAWLDDDEEASPTWIESLLATRRATGAQSVFGPVAASAPTAESRRAFVENLYSRRGPEESGLIDAPFGIGNSLQPRALFEGDDFDARANETGGEDDRLFAAWARAGARFAWSANAIVVEHVEGARAQFKYSLKRAFAYGQGPCETAWAERDGLALAHHMAVGAGQLTVFGAAAIVTRALNDNRCDIYLDRAARGAGKVFWMFEQRFYGEALAHAD